jgi:hypothetical protein
VRAVSSRAEEALRTAIQTDKAKTQKAMKETQDALKSAEKATQESAEAARQAAGKGLDSGAKK